MTTTAETPRAGFRLFFSYAHEDRALLEEVRKHLAAMERSGLIGGWDDRMITAGAEWEGRILESLEQADVILLLVSADFLSSNYCWDVEMRRALVRQAAREALVVPIILRPCDWTNAPFARLQSLPSEGRPIVLWSPQDSGFLDVVEGLRRALEDAKRDREERDARDAQEERTPKPSAEHGEERVLDAAIGSVVPVGRATDLVAMVRTPESGGLAAVLRQPDSGYSARPGDVRFADFTMDFPVDSSGRPQKAEVVLRLESGDVDPPSQEKTIEVRPGRDSRTCVFLVTARREGPLVLNLELRRRGVSVVQRLLRTSASPALDRRATPEYVVHSTGYEASPPKKAPPMATRAAPAPPAPPAPAASVPVTPPRAESGVKHMRAWMPSVAMFGLVLVVGLTLFRLAGPLPRAIPQPGSDSTTTTTREAADRLFSRVMESMSIGDTADALVLQPIALQAYRRAEPLDLDGVFHEAFLELLVDPSAALATTRRILESEPDHILALGTAARAQIALGDSAKAKEDYEHLLRVYDKENARNLVGYDAHREFMTEMRSEARTFVGSG